MSSEEVEEKIAKALNHCLQSLSISAADVDNVFFYGAGCIAGRTGVVSESISSILVDARIYVSFYVHKVNGCKYYDCHYRKRSLKQTAGHFLEYQESYYSDEDAGDIKCQVWIHIIVSS